MALLDAVGLLLAESAVVEGVAREQDAAAAAAGVRVSSLGPDALQRLLRLCQQLHSAVREVSHAGVRLHYAVLGHLQRFMRRLEECDQRVAELRSAARLQVRKGIRFVDTREGIVVTVRARVDV